MQSKALQVSGKDLHQSSSVRDLSQQRLRTEPMGDRVLVKAQSLGTDKTGSK